MHSLVLRPVLVAFGAFLIPLLQGCVRAQLRIQTSNLYQYMAASVACNTMSGMISANLTNGASQLYRRLGHAGLLRNRLALDAGLGSRGPRFAHVENSD